MRCQHKECEFVFVANIVNQCISLPAQSYGKLAVAINSYQG